MRRLKTSARYRLYHCRAGRREYELYTAVSGFPAGLRALCDEFGALLIIDEVMTGFRVALGGAQAHYDVEPDLTCPGKIIGGGMPVGAFGGRSEIMEKLAPTGPVYQAGTLSGNPIAMAAGLACLHEIAQPGVHQRLTELTDMLADGLCEKPVKRVFRLWLTMSAGCSACSLPMPRRSPAIRM